MGEIFSKAGMLSFQVQRDINHLRIGTAMFNEIENGRMKTNPSSIQERDWYHFWTDMNANRDEYADDLAVHTGMKN